MSDPVVEPLPDSVGRPVVVRKLNLEKQETWRYSGTLLRCRRVEALIEARFNRDDMPFHGILFGRDDRFVEAYFTDRWYNIFEIHDREDDHLKGWYCNVSLPAEIIGDEIRYVDLALDLLVYPDGRQLVLDEDEFARLPLDSAARASALAALKALQQLFRDSPGLRLEQKSLAD